LVKPDDRNVYKNPVKRFLIAIFIVAISAHSAGAKGQKWQEIQWGGTVTHVTDGDTLWVRPAGGSEAVKIRMDGIDAPEICQVYGDASRNALMGRVLHQNVSVLARSRDRYGRVLARVVMQREDVGEWMVGQGHAWAHHYKRYPSAYGAQEAQARAARRGLFADPESQDPAVFRKRHGSCH
jgi:micrococcal nuclease